MPGKQLRQHFQIVAAVCAVAGLSAPVVSADDIESTAPVEAVKQQWGMLERYCLDCHNFEDWAGGVAFDTLTPQDVPNHAEVWEEAIRKLRGRLMPPPGQPQPSANELNGFVSSLESYLDHAAEEQGPRPGGVAIHRLNRKEYANEIKNLLNLEVDASALLPADTRSEGFDNVANVLQVSPTFLDQYISAARTISIQAVGEAEPKPDQANYEAPDQKGQTAHVDGLPLGTRGGFQVEHFFPAAGEYEMSIRINSSGGSLLRSYPTGWLEYPHTLVMTIDGEEVFREDLGGKKDLRAVDQEQQQAVVAILNRFNNIKVPVPAGPHKVGVAFISKTYAESDRQLEHTVPGITMDSIPLAVGLTVTGPFAPAGVSSTPSREKIFSCYPDSQARETSCAEQIMSQLARKAFRRPLTETDLQTLMGFFAAGREQGGFETGIQKAIMAMLASPKFLYRAEELPDNVAPGDVFPLGDFELASRLSFFLWSQGPDEELLRVAESGQLRQGDNLEKQVRRMLADPRASSLVSNFAMQWLKADGIATIDPDPRIFPEFDEPLREAFREELKRFVGSVLKEDGSVLDLLSASHTFVNERLARHYGLPNVRGDRFRRVELADSRRWGLLGKGGVLMLTSYPNRTSPVLRGAYILESIIGAPPAAPPPEVEADLEDAPGVEATTVRARLEQHRADPSCNQCHGVIDPLGLALENFDAIGKWRDKDRWAGRPIDAHGQLASGEPISGPDDLREALLRQPRQFAQTFTEKLMTYALGRTVEHYDMPTVRAIVGKAAADDYRFSSLVLAIVQSAPFQMKSFEVEGEHDRRELSLQD